MGSQIIPQIAFNTAPGIADIYAIICFFHFFEKFLMNMDSVRTIHVSRVDWNIRLVDLIPFVLFYLFQTVSEFWFSNENAIN